MSPRPGRRINIDAFELAARREAVQFGAPVCISRGARPFARFEICEGDNLGALYRRAVGSVSDRDVKTGGGDRSLCHFHGATASLFLGFWALGLLGFGGTLVNPEALPLAVVKYFRHDFQSGYAETQTELSLSRHFDQLRPIFVERIKHPHLRSGRNCFRPG